MASLAALPPEIFYHTAEIADIKDSLLNLRLTCKVLNAKLRSMHFDQLYHTQRIIFTPLFLKRLIAISQNPSAPHLRARHLAIDVKTPCVSKIEKMQKFDNTSFGLELRPVGAEEEEAFKTMECLAYDHTTSVRDISNGRYPLPVELLASVLSVFPHLKSISFYRVRHSSSGFSPFEFDLIYPGLGFRPGKYPSRKLQRIAQEWMEWSMPSEFSKLWWCLFRALQLIGPSGIQTVTIDETVRRVVSVSFTEGLELLNREIASRENSRSVLDLRRLDITPHASHFEEADSGSLCRWLGSIGTQLTYLRLDFNYTDRFMLPISLKLPNLKGLEIEPGVLNFDNFMTFLGNLTAPLQTLILTAVSFPGWKKGVYFDLIQYVRQQFDKLRLFLLDLSGMRIYFQIVTFFLTGGWKPQYLYNFHIEEPPHSIGFQENLAAPLDPAYKTDEFWNSIRELESTDYGSTFALKYGDTDNPEFDDEDHDSDSDFSPYDGYEKTDYIDGVGWYHQEDLVFDTDDELEYRSDYESDQDLEQI
ncbi:hypothetical protein TWF730_002609 [Orbilia blumenaviensis]|uniref:F-box domain-containing protein n=1 Tax=Orbilia blumenaviensis TaxID=1796055 RepID=A0AAV9UDE6_9PEZI